MTFIAISISFSNHRNISYHNRTLSYLCHFDRLVSSRLVPSCLVLSCLNMYKYLRDNATLARYGLNAAVFHSNTNICHLVLSLRNSIDFYLITGHLHSAVPLLVGQGGELLYASLKADFVGVGCTRPCDVIVYVNWCAAVCWDRSDRGYGRKYPV